jgi:predicted nuclease of predicted toxin-antitoxin system
MKLLFDQNISYRIIKKLDPFFAGSSHVKSEGLVNATDLEIWEFAKENQFVLVTLDSDFNDIFLLKGYPPKILWFQTGNLKTDELAKILNNQINDLTDFINSTDLGCFSYSQFKVL